MAADLTLEVNGLHSMADSGLATHFANYPNHLCGFVAVNIVALNQPDTLDHLENYSPVADRAVAVAAAVRALMMAAVDLAFVDFDTTSVGK